MGQHNLLQELDELKASRITEPVEQPGELLLSEGHEGVQDRAALLILLPLVEEGLVSQLVVQAHGAEAGSLEEKVEVLIVGLVALFRTLVHRGGLLDLFDRGLNFRLRLSVRIECYEVWLFTLNCKLFIL